MQRRLSKIPHFATSTTLALVAVVVAAAGAHAWLSGAARAEPPLTPPPATPRPQPAHGRRVAPVQVVRFTLYDAGIYPSEAFARVGPVTVWMEDLAGGTPGILVEREGGRAGERVARVRRDARSNRGRQEVTLPPGRYLVYDESRPESRALLIVEP